MKTYLSLLVVFGFCTSTLFAVSPPEKTKNAVTGTYGICSEQASSQPTIRLELNDDGTFRLIDRTDPTKPIDTNGTWRMKNKTIRLDGYTADFSINDKWRVGKNPNCVVSRKGLEWTRLCRG